MKIQLFLKANGNSILRSGAAIFILTCIVIFCYPLLLVSQVSSEKQQPDFLERPELEYTTSDLRDPFRSGLSADQEGAGAPEAEALLAGDKKATEKKPSELFSFSIQGIIWNTDTPLAIINDRVVKINDAILFPKENNVLESVKIINIEKDGVSVEYSGVTEKLSSPATRVFLKPKGE